MARITRKAVAARVTGGLSEPAPKLPGTADRVSLGELKRIEPLAYQCHSLPLQNCATIDRSVELCANLDFTFRNCRGSPGSAHLQELTEPCA